MIQLFWNSSKNTNVYHVEIPGIHTQSVGVIRLFIEQEVLACHRKCNRGKILDVKRLARISYVNKFKAISLRFID